MQWNNAPNERTGSLLTGVICKLKSKGCTLLKPLDYRILAPIRWESIAVATALPSG